MNNERMPAKVRLPEWLGESCRSATTWAELVRPSDGSMVEFWCHRMSQQGKAGSGIRGWFRDGLFWSGDNADHWAPSEVTHWRCLRNSMQCAATAVTTNTAARCNAGCACRPTTGAPSARNAAFCCMAKHEADSMEAGAVQARSKAQAQMLALRMPLAV